MMIEGWPLADIVRKRLAFFKSVKCHFLATYRAAFVSILKVGCHAVGSQHHHIRDADPISKVSAEGPWLSKTVCMLSSMNCLCIMSMLADH